LTEYTNVNYSENQRTDMDEMSDAATGGGVRVPGRLETLAEELARWIQGDQYFDGEWRADPRNAGALENHLARVAGTRDRIVALVAAALALVLPTVRRESSAERTDADAQSTTVGVVGVTERPTTNGVGDHRGGVPCGACVTCACDAAPRVDQDGLCLGCGGVPVAVALLWGDPHVGLVVDLADADRATIARLIEEERRGRETERERRTILPPAQASQAAERAGWPTPKGWSAPMPSGAATAAVEQHFREPGRHADALLVKLANRLERLPDRDEVRAVMAHVRAVHGELAARAGDHMAVKGGAA
jgi:hypothetical protein